MVVVSPGFPTVGFSEGGPGGPPFGPPFTNFREGGARSLRNKRGGRHIFRGGARGGQQFSQGGARGGLLIFFIKSSFILYFKLHNQYVHHYGPHTGNLEFLQSIWCMGWKQTGNLIETDLWGSKVRLKMRESNCKILKIVANSHQMHVISIVFDSEHLDDF